MRADTGESVEGATVEAVSSEHEVTATTGPNGGFELTLPAGSYDVTVSYFGYEQATATVEVAEGQTTTRDFGLQPKPTAVLSGQVTDGSGHGWPLYAKVSVEGVPGGETYTNPTNGRYSFELPANATYTIHVQSKYPGYQALVKEVQVGSMDELRDFALTVDAETCAAPGYEHQRGGSFEDFSGSGVPQGWAVTDNVGGGQVWTFDDPGDRGNLTGGSGGFAIVDSDAYGSDGQQNTSLVSPVIDMSGFENPTVIFNQDYNNFVGSDVADVDVSIDGGETWETVLHQTDDQRGPRETTVALPQAAGESDVRVRFHYYEADYDYWWQVDNVLIGTLNCVPTDGGLVTGNVSDANTGDGLIGATVQSVDKPAEKTTTLATPDNPKLADGFYWMFSSVTGSHQFKASSGGYTAQTKSTSVATNWATRVDFALEAGKISVDPGSLEATRQMGESARRSFTVSNDGGAAVEVEVSERRGDFVIQRPDGDKASVGADVPWMSAEPTEFTVPAGESTQVTVNLDASVVTQPGTYTAALAVGEDTPYSVDPVEVTMNAQPPDTWGRIMGTVAGTSCQGSTGPLEGATVQFDSWARSYTWKTDAEGGYARWVDHRNSPFRLIAAKDGYAPQTRESSVTAGETTVEDFTLKEAFCD